jgi:hypothetical protein
MKAIAIAVAVVILASVTCLAGGPVVKSLAPQSPMIASTVKMGLHLVTHGITTCKGLPALTSANDLVRTWSLTGTGADVDVFFVLFNYDSMLVYEYGLDWPADWGTGSFTACPGAIVVGGITEPGDGVAFSYADCQIAQRVGGTKANFFISSWTWLLPASNGQINIVPNPATDDLEMVNCVEPAYLRSKLNPDTVYCAAVNVAPYTGPVLIGTEPTSWGAIKAMFK